MNWKQIYRAWDREFNEKREMSIIKNLKRYRILDVSDDPTISDKIEIYDGSVDNGIKSLEDGSN